MRCAGRRAVRSRRRAGRGRAQSRVHRHAGQHASVGRAPGRRRLHGAAAAAARARQRPGRTPTAPAGPTGTAPSSTPTTTSRPVLDVVFACRAVDGRHAGHPAGRAAPAAIAGLVLVNPVLRHRSASTPGSPPTSPGLVQSRPAIGGDIKKPGVAEPADDRTPVVAFASLQQLWQVTVADLAR